MSRKNKSTSKARKGSASTTRKGGARATAKTPRRKKKRRKDNLIPDEEIACPRCGEYGPTYWLGRNELCRPCIDQVMVPLEKEGSGVADLLRGIGALGGEVGGKALIVALLVSAPLAAITALGIDEEGVIGMLWSAVFGLLLGLTIIELSLQWADGDSPKTGAAFKRAVKKFFGAFIAELAAEFVVMLLAAVPLLIATYFALKSVTDETFAGIFVAGSAPLVIQAFKFPFFGLNLPLILSENAYGIDALNKSRKRLSGHRRAALAGWLLAAALPFLVGWGSYAGLVGLERAVGQVFGQAPPMEKPGIEAVFTVVLPVLQIPAFLLSAVLYIKLRKDHGKKLDRVVWEAETV